MDDRRSQIWSVIKETRTLPTLPGVIVKLNALAGSDKATIQEMARLVTSDQVLSARVLRLVNSPSYGFYRVSTISNAMILLGVDVVKSLALSSSIFEIMEKSVVGLWEHSLGAGVAANVIARKLQLPEEISTAALLHDIGKIILKIKFDAESTQIYKLACTGERSLIEEEQDILTTDHAEVGGWLARSWFLPDKLVEPISCHHDVAASGVHQVKTAVVHLADVLVKASGFGNSGDPFVPQLQEAAWDRLGLNEQLLAEIVAEVDEKLLETQNFSLEVLGSGE
jgi:putative nucleotidyltransferase with HDIG domain